MVGDPPAPFAHENSWERDAVHTATIGLGGRGFSIGGFGFGHGGWGSSVGVSTGGKADPESAYTAVAEILVYRGIKPADDRHAFDARQVKENLEDSVVRAEAKG